MRLRAAVLLLALLLGVAATAAAVGVEVESRIEPPVVRVGEPAIFTIIVRGSLSERVRVLAPLEVEHLQVVNGPTARNEVRWRRGGSDRRLLLHWRVVALRAGVARVAPLPIEISGERVEAPGARLEVQESTEGRSVLPPRRPGPFGLPRSERREPAADPPVLLRAEVDPRRPWSGEQAVFTLWVYTRWPLSRPSLESPPRFEGFWVDEVDLGDPSALAERVYYEGELWYRIPMMRRLIFPLRPGSHEIPPIGLSLEAGGSPFDPRTFLRQRRRRIELASGPVTVEARPLPEPPAGFSGAVGRLELDARLVPTSIELGEHATLEVTLEGTGHLEGVAPPEIGMPDGLELLPAEEDGDRRIAGTEVTARRTWRHALVPAVAGSYRLPAAEIVYFDPKDGEYRTAATPELVLDVAPAPPAAAPETPAAEPAVAPPPRRLPAAAPWAAAALAAGLALAAWWLVRRRSNGWLARWRRQLERAREADRPRQAAALLEDSWRDLLAERWQLSHDLPPASWEEALLEKGADPGRAAEVGALAAELQALRRAPELSAVGALTDELIARSLAVARSIG